eukprot:15481068-Alexandrium_andersonii.AAC.1
MKQNSGVHAITPSHGHGAMQYGSCPQAWPETSETSSNEHLKQARIQIQRSPTTSAPQRLTKTVKLGPGTNRV